MRLLDFRSGLRVLGHPAHTLLVHFPLAFWSLVFPLEVLGLSLGWDTGWRLAFWANLAGLATALPAMGSGLIDLVAPGHVAGAGAARTANRHLYVMLSAATCFVAEVLVRGGSAPPVATAAFLNLGLSLAGLLLLVWGGWLGGELVFGHGVGVRNGR